MDDNMDKTWHLAETDEEVKLTEFELLLWRVFFAFIRWQEDCESCVSSYDLDGNELAVLHIIRMRNRPKTVYEIARILNRDDHANIQYCIKKLLKYGLIKKAKNPIKKAVAYEITESGEKDTNAYTDIRKKVLIDMVLKDSQIDLKETSKTLSILKGVYDEASNRITTSFKGMGHNKNK